MARILLQLFETTWIAKMGQRERNPRPELEEVLLASLERINAMPNGVIRWIH